MTENQFHTVLACSFRAFCAEFLCLRRRRASFLTGIVQKDFQANQSKKLRQRVRRRRSATRAGTEAGGPTWAARPVPRRPLGWVVCRLLQSCKGGQCPQPGPDGEVPRPAGGPFGLGGVSGVGVWQVVTIGNDDPQLVGRRRGRGDERRHAKVLQRSRHRSRIDLPASEGSGMQ